MDRPLAEWSAEVVSVWVTDLGPHAVWHDYARFTVSQNIDGAFLSSASKQQLTQRLIDLGLLPVHAKTMVAAVQTLRDVKCPEHGAPIIAYCSLDSKPLCGRCNHAHDHDLLSHSKATQHLSKELEDLVWKANQATETLSKHLAKLNDIQSHTEKQQTYMQNQVTKYFGECIEKLRAREAQFLAEINQQAEEKLAIIGEETKRATEQQCTFREMAQQLNQVKREGLLQMTEAKRRLESILTNDNEPDWAAASRWDIHFVPGPSVSEIERLVAKSKLTNNRESFLADSEEMPQPEPAHLHRPDPNALPYVITVVDSNGKKLDSVGEDFELDITSEMIRVPVKINLKVKEDSQNKHTTYTLKDKAAWIRMYGRRTQESVHAHRFKGDFAGVCAELPNPAGIAYDGSKFYVSSSGKILVFDGEWKLSSTWLGYSNPVGVTPCNFLTFVCDYVANNIKVVEPDGTIVRTLGKAGSHKTEINGAKWLAISEEGLLYIADCGNHRILVWTQEGKHVRHWGKSGSSTGEFNFPAGIAIYDGLVYVIDSYNNRIQVFTKDGKFERAWLCEGGNDWAGLALADDTVFVCSRNNNRIQMFSLEGEFKGSIALHEKLQGQLASPLGLCVVAGTLFVSDYSHNQISRFV